MKYAVLTFIHFINFCFFCLSRFCLSYPLYSATFNGATLTQIVSKVGGFAGLLNHTLLVPIYVTQAYANDLDMMPLLPPFIWICQKPDDTQILLKLSLNIGLYSGNLQITNNLQVGLILQCSNKLLIRPLKNARNQQRTYICLHIHSDVPIIRV